jgi:hypothetical protein
MKTALENPSHLRSILAMCAVENTIFFITRICGLCDTDLLQLEPNTIKKEEPMEEGKFREKYFKGGVSLPLKDKVVVPPTTIGEVVDIPLGFVAIYVGDEISQMDLISEYRHFLLYPSWATHVKPWVIVESGDRICRKEGHHWISVVADETPVDVFKMCETHFKKEV